MDRERHPRRRIRTLPVILLAASWGAGCIVGIASPLSSAPGGDGGGAESSLESGGNLGGQTPPADGGGGDHGGVPPVDSGPIFDGTSPEAGAGEASCSPDLSTDPSHCGRCGHACDTASCSGGTCAPRSLHAGGGAISELRIHGTTLYWMEGQAGAYSCALPGCSAVTVIVGGTHLEGYAVADRAYVVEGFADTGAATRSYPLDGSGSAVDLTVSLVGMGGPMDTDTDNVFITTNDSKGNPFFGFVPRSATNWGDAYIVTYLAQPQVALRVTTLAGTEYAFWTEPDRVSRSSTVSTSTPTKLAGGSGVAGLMVDATYVFWTAEGDGTVRRCDALASDCSGATTLLSGQAAPSRVVADATGIAWANRGTNGNGAIAECVYPDCADPFLLAQGQSDPHELAMDGTYVYWATGSTIWRVPR